MVPHPPAHIAGPVHIVGSGLLGASIGLALTRKGVLVRLFDASASNVALARDLGAGQAGSVAEDTDREAPQLIVVATPPDVTATVVAQQLQEYPTAVVTDVASVKGRIVADLLAVGQDISRYIGSHPLAGRERGGAIAARGDLFAGRPWVVSPHADSSAELVGVASDLAIDVGATPVVLDAERHDKAVALVSHVPQIASTMVASLLNQGDPSAIALAGQGLRDVTRVAASDPELWTQILSGNAPAVVALLEELQTELSELIRALHDPQAPGALLTIAQLIAAGNSGQARIPGKHGAVAQDYDVVSVIVDDTPGQLAALLQAIGDLGVNIEDLSLEHSPGQQVGLAQVSVLPASSDFLSESLSGQGWKVARG